MSKYFSKKVETEDGVFDSKKEYNRWIELKLLEKAGQIKNIERQRSFLLIPKNDKFREISYKADFVYNPTIRMINDNPAGTIPPVFVEDVKGYRGGDAYTRFKMKQKLMYHIHGIEVFEV